MATYSGPIHGEPLPIELHNTLYADRGEPRDGLEDGAGLRRWVRALADRLPVRPDAVERDRLADFLELRGAVRAALHAVLERRPVPETALSTLNDVSARSPQSLQLEQSARRLSSDVRYHASTAADVVLGVIASSTIALVSGPHAGDLRTCGAPGCVLLFLKDHPRREWCSAACGNRARQARHYARTRARHGGA
jgi:predicted RNA-binding Zn ribbon-like protein